MARPRTPRRLRLAAAQLDQAQRETIYLEEWLPELIYVLRGAESRPITRLVRDVTFALGLLKSARHIAQPDRMAVQQEVMEALSQMRLRAWLSHRGQPASVLAYFGDDFSRNDIDEIFYPEELIRERVWQSPGSVETTS